MVRDVDIHHIGSLAIVQLAFSGIARLDNGRDKGKGYNVSDDDPLTRTRSGADYDGN